MAVKVKPGMYCVREEKLVAAQKQTHKARSLLLGPLTYGAAVKVGEWHCPGCGGPVVPKRQAGSRAQKAVARTPDRIDTRRNRVREGAVAVKVTALPDPTKWPGGSVQNARAVLEITGALFGKKRSRRTGNNRRIQDELRTLPAYIGRLEPKAGEELVKKLRKLGAEAELVEPDDEDHAPNEVAGDPGLAVLLRDAGPQRNKVIKATRAATGRGPREVKAWVESAPAQIRVLTRESGEALVTELGGVGAEVELVRLGADETTADAQPPDMRGGEASEAEPSQDAPAPATPTPPDDPTDQIRKLGELRDAGLVTQDEFESKKAEMLSRL